MTFAKQFQRYENILSKKPFGQNIIERSHMQAQRKYPYLRVIQEVLPNGVKKYKYVFEDGSENLNAGYGL